MSFTSTIKNEITKLEGNKLEYISELSCIIRNNAKIADDIIITVENNAVARRIFKLIKQIYDVTPAITVRKRYNFNSNLSYILKIKNKKEIILKDLSIVIDGVYQNIPKNYIINGGNPVKLQKLLNHKTIDQTMKYVNLYATDIADDLDLYNPLDNFKRKNYTPMKRTTVMI